MTEPKNVSRSDVAEGLGTNRKNRCRRSETRIVIKGNRDLATISAAIREWLVPLLVDRFMAEHGQRDGRHRSTGTNGIQALQ